MLATKGGRRVCKMVTIADKGGRGVRQMLTIADEGVKVAYIPIVKPYN